jgi:TM2 domain-containing membrane protein YozV
VSLVPADKKIPSALLAILLGAFGIHKFYYGANGAGMLMLLCTVLGPIIGYLTCGLGYFLPGLMATIGFVEGIIYLLKSNSDFYSEYELMKKPWF